MLPVKVTANISRAIRITQLSKVLSNRAATKNIASYEYIIKSVKHHTTDNTGETRYYNKHLRHCPELGLSENIEYITTTSTYCQNIVYAR